MFCRMQYSNKCETKVSAHKNMYLLYLLKQVSSMAVVSILLGIVNYIGDIILTFDFPF